MPEFCLRHDAVRDGKQLVISARKKESEGEREKRERERREARERERERGREEREREREEKREREKKSGESNVSPTSLCCAQSAAETWVVRDTYVDASSSDIVTSFALP